MQKVDVLLNKRAVKLVYSPCLLPSVWSVEGPLLEPLPSLAHWYWPTLISSQPQVSFSKEQPTNAEPVSFTAIEDTTQFDTFTMMTFICNVAFQTINIITWTAAWCDGDVIDGNKSSVIGLGHNSQLSESHWGHHWVRVITSGPFSHWVQAERTSYLERFVHL